MRYTIFQWMLLFYFYAFLGWIWECSFVSFTEKKWINRGFLYGPWIPIYGFGAVTVLWITLPVRASLPLVFLLGMTGATLLELATGYVMEKIFGMRYWDYSTHFLNFHGYICLYASVGWGIFSILMVRFLHRPVEKFLLRAPAWIVEPLAQFLLVAFVIDATLSVRDALDLKKLLRSLTENNAAAVALKEKFGEISSGVVTMKEDFQKALREAEQEFAVRKWERRNERILRENGEPFLSLSERLRGYAQKVRLQSEAVRSAEEKTRLTEFLQKLEELRKKAEKIESDFHWLKQNGQKRAQKIFRRNPSARSDRYREAFREIQPELSRSIDERKNRKRDQNKGIPKAESGKDQE